MSGEETHAFVLGFLCADFVILAVLAVVGFVTRAVENEIGFD